MAAARANLRTIADRSIDAMRAVIVAGCALALIFAGRGLPL